MSTAEGASGFDLQEILPKKSGSCGQHSLDTFDQFVIPIMNANHGIEWVVHPLVVAKYPKDDLIGIFFGYFSLLVYEIQAVYITLFIRNRDLLTFWCCFTHMLSEIMNILLKRILKQPRPENGAPEGGLFEGKWGMPSQHCHCFAYLITMALLLTFHYYRKRIALGKRMLVLVMSVAGLILQVIGRVYLGFHTLEQCFVGSIFGASSAFLFYLMGLRYILPHSDLICRLPLVRWFSFRRDLLSESPVLNENRYKSQRLSRRSPKKIK